MSMRRRRPPLEELPAEPIYMADEELWAEFGQLTSDLNRLKHQKKWMRLRFKELKEERKGRRALHQMLEERG